MENIMAEIKNLIHLRNNTQALVKFQNFEKMVLEMVKENFILKEKLAKFEEFEYKSPFIYDKTGSGPFCYKCHVKGKQKINLENRGNGAWFCHICNTPFCDDSYDHSRDCFVATIGNDFTDL